jgi:hypothetical protein
VPQRFLERRIWTTDLLLYAGMSSFLFVGLSQGFLRIDSRYGEQVRQLHGTTTNVVDLDLFIHPLL